jgi:hypothetical protein
MSDAKISKHLMAVASPWQAGAARMICMHLIKKLRTEPSPRARSKPRTSQLTAALQGLYSYCRAASPSGAPSPIYFRRRSRCSLRRSHRVRHACATLASASAFPRVACHRTTTGSNRLQIVGVESGIIENPSNVHGRCCRHHISMHGWWVEIPLLARSKYVTCGESAVNGQGHALLGA